MKRNSILILLCSAILALALSGCNSVAKNFGGTVTVNLDEGRKLEEVTWKDDSLWILTRPMREDETAETYEFKQDSNFGIIEGKVVLVESVTDK